MDQFGFAAEEYRFAAFRLFPERRELLRNDERVVLPPRALSVLIVLVRHEGRIATKDELYEAVWGKVFVEENNLMVQISTLRRVMGHELIVTVPGRGYKLTADVTGGEHRPASGVVAGATASPEPAERTNLPHRPDPLIDRGAELIELGELLRRNRLVTLAGPGGIGKTRLAIELGWRQLRAFPDGVWLVDLAPLRESESIGSTVALALRVKLADAEHPVEVIAGAIAARRLLLIADNCEHVAAAAADLINQLLLKVPGLTVLTTSQTSLHVTAEQVFRLGPLPVPALDERDMGSYGAVKLFVAKAEKSDRRFVLSTDNAPQVGEICRRLEGNPFALEMAAARLPLLGLNGLRAGLGTPLDVLNGPNTFGSRHRTLRQMIDWSYGLLSGGDQRLFRRLGIFAGSFSLEAAMVVGGSDGSDRWEAVDALGRLVDKSLVDADGYDEPRYRLLETSRLYAAELLSDSGEGDAITMRYALSVAALCERAERSRESVSPENWRAIYCPEVDNIRWALDWALSTPGRGQLAIVLAGASAPLWDMLDLSSVARRYCDRALSLVDADTPAPDAARLFRYCGGLWREADRPRSVELLERAAELYRSIPDCENLGAVLAILGGNYNHLGRHDDAKAALDEAVELLSAGNRPMSLWTVLNESGSLALHRNEPIEARRCYAAARDLAHAKGEPIREHIACMNLGEVEYLQGSIDRAIDYAQIAAAGLRSTNQRSYLAKALVNLGSYLILKGEPRAAECHLIEALPLLRDRGGCWLSLCVLELALLLAVKGQHTAAADVRGFANSHFRRTAEIAHPNFAQVDQLLSELLSGHLAIGEFTRRAEIGASWHDGFAIDHVQSCLVSLRSLAAPDKP
jgi:predicted ATPase/DNA-binding winged helix-turn-helix (wHTH) protein